MSAVDATSLPAASTLRHFHVLAKPTGAICNLDCKYCFFLSKEMLYPGDRFRMVDELLETYVRQLLESQPGPEVTIAWQGGEPTLMGLDFFRRAIECVQKHRRPGISIEHTIQTNGTELTDQWCEFFRDHRFLVGLRLDGPREMHDAYRVDKGGRGTFDKVMQAARLMQKHEVAFNVLTTVNAANATIRSKSIDSFATTSAVDRPMRMMADLLRRGHHADEVMALLAAELCGTTTT